MARISEHNVSFQEDQLSLRRKGSNIMENKTKRPPFFLPQMNLKEKSTRSEKCQRPGIELYVRGHGVKTAGQGFSNKARRKQSFQSPSNKVAAHKIPGITLPPIDSKSLTHNPAMKN